MKIVINAVLAQCILCYSQQFLQLMLELLLLYSNCLLSLVLKKKIFHVLRLVLALKQKRLQRDWHLLHWLCDC